MVTHYIINKKNKAMEEQNQTAISMSEITTAFKEALNVALEPMLASIQKNNTPAESKTEEAPVDELHEATKQFLAAKQAQPLGGKII